MTIYAIVNQLLTPADSGEINAPVWTLISPAGILQGGNPYFVPDFASIFEARIALAVRIGKLGKGIAPRFAHRYIESVAPAVIFVAADMLNKIKEKGLPWSAAVSYDRCLAFGKFIPMPLDDIANCKCSLSLESIDGTGQTVCSLENISPKPDEIVASLSRDNTLKTGDIILIGIPGKGPQVEPGIIARLLLNGEESLRFNIR